MKQVESLRNLDIDLSLPRSLSPADAYGLERSDELMNALR